jgi:hypothetical protein
MNIVLQQLPESVLGIYGDSKNLMPRTMRRLHPDAAASYLAIDALGVKLRVSDMFRSPEASLRAMQAKPGLVQPPGFSAHNYGLAIDVSLGDCLKRFSMTKTQFNAFMESHGWTCHRLDDARGPEDWHYNFQVRHLIQPGRQVVGSRGRAQDAGALRRPDGASTSLKHRRPSRPCGFYSGAKWTARAVRSPRQRSESFQRAWQIRESGLGTEVPRRVLALATTTLDVRE